MVNVFRNFRLFFCHHSHNLIDVFVGKFVRVELIETVTVFYYAETLVVFDEEVDDRDIVYAKLKKAYPEAINIHVTRPGYVSHLTKGQKAHLTEILVDEYDKYDYEIVNNGSLEDLEKQVLKIAKQIDKEEKYNRKVEKRTVAKE